MNTDVILKENIDGLGTIGDVVSVKAGFMPVTTLSLKASLL